MFRFFLKNRFLTGLSFITVLGVSIIIFIQVSTVFYTDLNDVPPKKVGIVFGASVHNDGSLSPILRDRMDGAVQLYQQKRIQKMLLTGDNSRKNYDEVTAMKRYALAQGIPDRDIALDHAGFSTYESCYRAHLIFKIDEAVLITQQYHMPRSLYTCRKLGVEAVGYGLKDFELYPTLKFPYTLREYAADLKAWCQLNITHPKPKLLGTTESIE